MSAIIPGAILGLLADVEKGWTKHLEENENTDLKYWFPLSITITSHDDHVATLYEEGWDFEPPKKENS